MNRRELLKLIATAPLASLAPWRPPGVDPLVFNGLAAGFDMTWPEPSRSWIVVWNERRIEGVFPATDERFVRARYVGDGERERVIRFDASDDGLKWRELP